MNTKTKKVAIAGLSALLAATVCSGLLVVKKHTSFVEAKAATAANNYFYDGLYYTDQSGREREFVLAKEFYRALDSMAKDGDFKDGKVDYSISDIVTSDQIKAWVTGEDVTIPKAFSAARDAYLTDHPEIFYIDFYKLTISAAMSDDVYTAYIDSGREANLYYANDFTSEAQVDAAISAFDEKVNEIVAAANETADNDQYGTNKDAVKARYVNSYLIDNIEYDDDAASSDDVAAYAHSRTAYGGIINGIAVCSGYSRAYKVVLDKLGIPCLTVSGYSLGKDSHGDPTNGSAGHEWNYVWLENVKNAQARSNDGGKWYSVDVTWNDSNSNHMRYMGNGSLTISKDHATDGVISTSGYELKFPALSQYDYGCDTDTEGISYSVAYEPEGGTDDHGSPLMTTYGYLSYNGKGAKRLLEEDGLRMIYRMAYYVGGEVTWLRWIDVNNYPENGFDEAEDGSYTRAMANSSVLYSQFAITDYTPDYQQDGHPTAFYFSFDNEDNEEDWGEHISVISEVVENKSYGTYVSAPHVLSSTPNYREAQYISSSLADPNTESMMDANKAFTIEVKYNEPLRVLDENEDIGISFECMYFPKNAYKYAFLVPLDEKGTMVEFADEAHTTLRFKFCPSLMFEHDGEHYSFSFTNVGSDLTQYDKNGEPYTSDKAPNPITFRYARNYVWCTKCLPGGRLYVDCVAKPTLMMSNTDLSEVGFIDPETEKPYSIDKRSQMVLVADRVSDATKADMLDGIDDIEGGDIKQEDIVTSETYDIELRLCGKIVSIPNGAKVRVSLGFPEDYGPDMIGVTYRLYHYKHDNAGNFIGVEEIPCVVTQFGIVATVDSFSPYMVAVVPADKASGKKTVYANVEGNGGKITDDAGVEEIAEGGSYTCTIAPDSGYQLYKVTLNGKDVTSKVSGTTLTLGYDELAANNEIEVQYISTAAAARFEEKGIVDTARVVVPVSGAIINDKAAPSPGGGLSTGAVVAIVIVVIVLIGGAAIAFVVIRKRKPVKAAATAQPKAKKAAKPAAAPAKAPAAKVATAKPAPAAPKTTATTTAAKPSATTTVKPATATAAKPAQTEAKPAATAKPVTKPVAAVKPVNKPTTKK